MKREDVIRMAQAAGGTEMQPFDYGARPDSFVMSHEALERFAALVAAAYVGMAIAECTKAIRALGEQK